MPFNRTTQAERFELVDAPELPKQASQRAARACSI
jgi:hypothetical protein